MCVCARALVCVHMCVCACYLLGSPVQALVVELTDEVSVQDVSIDLQ